MANLVDLVIDGGWDNVGSTIIDLSGAEPEIMRR
jgi:tRNA A37 threonylcarbamoyladenosine synthetase subunit TsaC/SUA5/YrdC